MAQKGQAPLLRVHSIIMLLLVALIGLVGYIYLMKNSMPDETAKSPIEKITYVSFTCDNKKSIQAVFFNQKVELTLSDGRSLLLLQALSASGARYTNPDESIVFWNKGNTGFIEEGKNSTNTFANCLETPQK